MNPRRDADRVLAHSYADEVYRRPTYEWYRPTLGDQIKQAAGCLAHVAALLIGSLVIWGLLVALFLGVQP